MNGDTDWHPTTEQLAAFDRGQLPAAKWENVERHVAGCAACCRSLESVPDDALTALLKVSAGRAHTPDVPGDDTRVLGDRDDTPGSPLPPELAAHPRYQVLGFL